jgi:hypothetical protein
MAAMTRKTPKNILSFFSENEWAILAPSGAVKTVAGAINAKPIRLT